MYESRIFHALTTATATKTHGKGGEMREELFTDFFASLFLTANFNDGNFFLLLLPESSIGKSSSAFVHMLLSHANVSFPSILDILQGAL